MKNKKTTLQFFDFKIKFFILLINISIFGIFFLLPKGALLAHIDGQELIELTNQARLKNSLPPLEINEKLAAAAKNKCQDMVEKNYFAHTTPSGKHFWQWIRESGYNYLYAGENLAMDFFESEEAVKAWLASPTHRANILNPKFKHIGVAAKEGFIDGGPIIVIAQEFGTLNESLTSNQSNIGVSSNQNSSFFVLPNLLNYQKVDLIIEANDQKENYNQLIYPFLLSGDKNQNWQIAFSLDKNNLLVYENDQSRKDLTKPFLENKKDVLGEGSFKTHFAISGNIPAGKIHFDRFFFFAAFLIIAAILFNLLTLSGAFHFKSKRGKMPIANL